MHTLWILFNLLVFQRSLQVGRVTRLFPKRNIHGLLVCNFYWLDALPVIQPSVRALKGWTKHLFECSSHMCSLSTFWTFFNIMYGPVFPSVQLWHCWLGDRKGIRPVKNCVFVCWWWWLGAQKCPPVIWTSQVNWSNLARYPHWHYQ